MTTPWRDEASQQVKDDLDDLLHFALSTAQEQLDEDGEFAPFTVSVPADAVRDDDGTDVQHGTPEVADDVEFVDVEKVLAGCWHYLESTVETNRAVGVVTNVGGPDGDAIAVTLEHRDGPAIEVYLPYVVNPKVGGKKPAQKHRYSDLLAAEGTRRVWV